MDDSLPDVIELMMPIELSKCELVIEKGKQTFIEVGNASKEKPLVVPCTVGVTNLEYVPWDGCWYLLAGMHYFKIR